MCLKAGGVHRAHRVHEAPRLAGDDEPSEARHPRGETRDAGHVHDQATTPIRQGLHTLMRVETPLAQQVRDGRREVDDDALRRTIPATEPVLDVLPGIERGSGSNDSSSTSTDSMRSMRKRRRVWRKWHQPTRRTRPSRCHNMYGSTVRSVLSAPAGPGLQ